MSEDRRVAARLPVLRGAKVHCNGAVVDCLVLDIASTGMRVSNEVPFLYPDQVTIELRSGGMWHAVRRWQRGVETGFEFTGFAGLHGAAAATASRLYDELRNAGVMDVTARLREARHFDYPALQAASAAVEEAVRKLEEMLRVAGGRPMVG